MIDLILQMLTLDEFYGKSKNIDIAKGLYKQPDSVKEGLKQVKRKMSWR